MPDQENPDARDIIVSFRITRLEAAHLDAAAAALNHPRCRADFARAAALAAARQKVPPPARPVRLPPRRKPSADMEALARILAQIGRIGGAMNQLARGAHRNGGVLTLDSLRPIAADLSGAREMIQAALDGGRHDH